MSISILLSAHNIPNNFPPYWYFGSEMTGSVTLLIGSHMQQKYLVAQEYAAMSHEKNPKTTAQKSIISLGKDVSSKIISMSSASLALQPSEKLSDKSIVGRQNHSGQFSLTSSGSSAYPHIAHS